MKKTMETMIKEMFTANYEKVYELAGHRYFQYKDNRKSKEETEIYILSLCPHILTRKRVEKIYREFTKLS